MPDFFATCPRGLETALVDELAGCAAHQIRALPGGVHFCGDWPVCYQANLESRLATRILWRIGKGPYAREDDIYALARAVPWFEFFPLSCTFRVLTTAIRSPLKSIEFVTLRIKDAVCDRFRDRHGERPSVDSRHPDIRIHSFLTESECTLYIDTSGAPLWQRGLRQHSVEAPLKENLAAGILKLTGWQPGTPLYDPMCGSGTFLLEAAQMALQRAPGLGRTFGFEHLLSFDALAWAKLRTNAEARCLPPTPQAIFGSDIDGAAVRASKRNLQEARLGNVVQVVGGDLLAAETPCDDPGVLVANPPYGERIGELDELAAFYPQLGSVLKKNFAGWNCYFFTADTRLPKLVGLKPGRKTPLFNGALECRLYEFRMVAGSNRKPRPGRPSSCHEGDASPNQTMAQ